MIQYIHKISTLKVGKEYHVPCVFVDGHNLHYNKRWMPIIGDLHEDTKYLGFPYKHYHFDFRFIDGKTIRGMKKLGDLHRHGVVNGNIEMITVLHECAVKGKIKFKPMRLLRQTGTFPYKPEFSNKLEPHFKKCKLIDGHICPHKGVSIKTVPTKDGVAICPGHGLAWNITSGKMVERSTLINQ